MRFFSFTEDTVIIVVSGILKGEGVGEVQVGCEKRMIYTPTPYIVCLTHVML